MFLYNTTYNMFLQYTDTDQGTYAGERRSLDNGEESCRGLVCVHTTGCSHTHVSLITAHAEVDTTPDLPLGSRNVKLDGSNCPLQVMDVPTYTVTQREGF